jgi:hypothetical protein
MGRAEVEQVLGPSICVLEMREMEGTVQVSVYHRRLDCLGHSQDIAVLWDEEGWATDCLTTDLPPDRPVWLDDFLSPLGL